MPQFENGSLNGVEVRDLVPYDTRVSAASILALATVNRKLSGDQRPNIRFQVDPGLFFSLIRS